MATNLNLTKYISKSISYNDYLVLTENLVAQGKTTGDQENTEHINYTKLNLARMHRLNKTITLTDSLKTILQHVKSKFTFLVVTETWCGDAAQNLPVLNAIECACENIELKLVLRDENLELIDHYLTNGGRAIPKLICIETSSLNELFTWGPRPKELLKITSNFNNNNVPVAERGEIIQRWYNQNKGVDLQHELQTLINDNLIKN